MFYIYIIYSETFDKYYIGQTDNCERRLNEHNTSKHTTFTSKYRPWVLAAYFEVGNDRGIARKIENKLKSLKSREIISKLVKHSGDSLFLAQLVRVPTHRD
jgi:putative endonuclease